MIIIIMMTAAAKVIKLNDCKGLYRRVTQQNYYKKLFTISGM